LTREEAQARAEAVRPMRYEDDGYFWINDMNNIMVMHPIKPALEGQILPPQGSDRQVLLPGVHQGGEG
jgi:methyl-accepting chemotaxis protein